MIKAVLSGDADAAGVVRQAVRQQLPGWLPGRG
jgi:hypothetical protein